MEYPKEDAAPEIWIAWYRWKLDDMDRLLTAAYRDEARIRVAARELLDDVRRRYPGEELRCPYMRALDEAVEAAP